MKKTILTLGVGVVAIVMFSSCNSNRCSSYGCGYSSNQRINSQQEKNLRNEKVKIYKVIIAEEEIVVCE